jgi:hypothetical protein
MEEVKNVSDRKKFLVNLVAEGHQQTFSSQYMKNRVVAITNLLEAIRLSSTQTSGWNSSKIAEQMVGLHGHMVADTKRFRRSRASTAVLAWRKLRNASSSRTQRSRMFCRPHQLTATPSNRDGLASPLEEHSDPTNKAAVFNYKTLRWRTLPWR